MFQLQVDRQSLSQKKAILFPGSIGSLVPGPSLSSQAALILGQCTFKIFLTGVYCVLSISPALPSLTCPPPISLLCSPRQFHIYSFNLCVYSLCSYINLVSTIKREHTIFVFLDLHHITFLVPDICLQTSQLLLFFQFLLFFRAD